MKLLILLLLIAGTWGFLVDDIRKDVIHSMDSNWKDLKTMARADVKIDKNLRELSQMMKKIPKLINKVEYEINAGDYERALHRFQNSSTWKTKWAEIATLTSPIDVIYGYFKVFPDMPEAFLPNATMLDFDANTVIDLILKPLNNDKNTNMLVYLSEHAHTAIISSSAHENLFELLRIEMEKSPCLLQEKTEQLMLYGLYNVLSLKDIKEYVVVNFAFMLKMIINGTIADTSKTRQTLRIQATEKARVAQEIIAKASNEYWTCDPFVYEEGVNFESFKELLQGYIENEGRMQPKGSCKQSCEDFTFVKSRCSYPDDDSCIQHRVCLGNIVDCKYIAADASVCLANPPRRFDYIDYKRGPLLGKSQPCNGVTTRRDSYWRFFYHCSNCFCKCDDPSSPTTVRHISLEPAVADPGNVISGIKFAMKDGILHLQIEQGTPLPNGFIKSPEWKELPVLNKRNQDSVMQLDYMHRAFDLDEIQLPNNYLITGVKFRQLGSHVNLEVQATQINPITIKLVSTSTHWLSNDNTPESYKPRKKIQLKNLDIPILTSRPSRIDSTNDTWIEFDATSDELDVAQTTIPYIDTQEVKLVPSLWLSAIETYHKGQDGYGGFLGIKISSYNLNDMF